MTDQQKDDVLSTIFKQTDLAAANAMLSNCTDRFDELSEAIENSAGACDDMYAIQLDNLNGDIDILKSGLSDLGISIYKDLNGSLRGAAKLATDMVGELSEAYKSGGMEGMIGAVGGCLSEVVNVIAEYAPQVVSMGISLLQSFISGIAQNAGGLAAAVAEVGKVFIEGLFTLVPQVILAGIDIIVELAQSITQQLPQLINSGIQAVANFVQGILQRLPTIIGTALQLISCLAQSIMQGIPQLANIGVGLINGLTESIRENLPQMIPVAMQALVSFSASLRENVGRLVDAGLEMIMTLAQSLIDNIPVFVQTIPTIVTNIAGIINDNAPKLLSAGIQLIIHLLTGIIQAIPTIIANIPQIIQAIVSVFMAFNWLSLGSKIITTIGSGISSVITSIPQMFSNFVQTVHNIVSSFSWRSLGRGIIMTIANGIKSFITTIPRIFINIGKSAVQALTNINWLEVGKTIIQLIGQAISGAGGFIVDAIKGIGGGIIDGIKGLFGGGEETEEATESGAELADSYANGISKNTEAVAAAANGMAATAFNGMDPTGAMAAGTQAGAGFSEGFTGAVATGGFGQDVFNNNMVIMGSAGATALNNGFSTGLSSSTVDIGGFLSTPVFGAGMQAAGSAGASTFVEGFNTGIAGNTITTGALSVDASGVSAALAATGTDGASALGAGIEENSEAVTQAATAMGDGINKALDVGWSKANSNAQAAMKRLSETVTGAARSAAAAIKSAFESMTITIPKPKIPEIKVSKSDVPYGEGGKVNVPKFSVSWNALGGIFDSPTIFNTPAGMQGVGEAGPEAILPLDTLWAKMKEILNEAIAASSGASLIDTFLEKLKGIGSGGNGGQPELAGAGGPTIQYSPVYNLYGSAGKDEIAEADRMSQAEFNRLMKQYEREQRRRSL